MPVTVRDPMGRPVASRYTLVPQDGARVAVFEMSAASGLWMVKPEDRDLPRASTFGTGELLRHALREGGAERVLIGIGGSATNDGGMGMAAALGFRFLDGDGAELEPFPGNLDRLARIVPPDPPFPANVPVTVACDVRNPLLGERGATRVYGPQKGLRDEAEWARLEGNLKRLADVCAGDLRPRPPRGARRGGGGRAGVRVAHVLQRHAAPRFRPGGRPVATGGVPSNAPTWFSPAKARWTRKRWRARPPWAWRPWRGSTAGPWWPSEGGWRWRTFPRSTPWRLCPPGPMTLAESTAQAADLLRASVRRAAAWMRVGYALDKRSGG